MKNTVKLIFALTLAVMVGCGQEAEVTAVVQESDSLTFDYKVFEKTTGDCEQSCLSIRIKQLRLQGAPEIQKTVDSTLLSMGSGSHANIDALIDVSIEEFSRLLEEIPSYDMPWEIERMALVSYNNNGLLGVSVSDYSFTGGAHPNSFHVKRVFRVHDGKMLRWEDFFDASQMITFLSYAERKFRKDNNISDKTTLEEAGFWFEDNVFFLPENYGIDSSGLFFFYNAYEIAPYSEGAIILEFTWDQISPFLQKPYGDLFGEVLMQP
ncbi:MAG: DUF3298 and DUF4163 domain-containing protein [Cryomorphaceae bacterium]|nr:DUF3298 and DUF4163 domain-containing protein [Cryomorphaceae bacterium]